MGATAERGEHVWFETARELVPTSTPPRWALQWGGRTRIPRWIVSVQVLQSVNRPHRAEVVFLDLRQPGRSDPTEVISDLPSCGGELAVMLGGSVLVDGRVEELTHIEAADHPSSLTLVVGARFQRRRELFGRRVYHQLRVGELAARVATELGLRGLVASGVGPVLERVVIEGDPLRQLRAIVTAHGLGLAVVGQNLICADRLDHPAMRTRSWHWAWPGRNVARARLLRWETPQGSRRGLTLRRLSWPGTSLLDRVVLAGWGRDRDGAYRVARQEIGVDASGMETDYLLIEDTASASWLNGLKGRDIEP